MSSVKLAFLSVSSGRQPVGWYWSVHRSELAIYHLENVFYPIVPPAISPSHFFTFHFFSSSLRDSSCRAQPLQRSKESEPPPFRTSNGEYNLSREQKFLLNTLSSESSNASVIFHGQGHRGGASPPQHTGCSHRRSHSHQTLEPIAFAFLSVPAALPHKTP